MENLRAILEVETGVPGSQQALLHNGRELKEGKLGEQQVQAGDLILLMQRQVASRSQVQQPAAAAGGVPAGSQNPLSLNPDGSASNPEFLIQTLNNPQQLSQLPPDLADAVRGGDIAKLQDQLQKIHRMRREAAEEERRFLRMAEEDPFNPEVQRRLEEAIQQKNVMENFEQALEHNPEAFGVVHMLYVHMEVNGHPLKAFIDSGAQSTIMGRSCAERCGLLRLMDRRFAGTAVGVGSATILGRVHMVPLKAGSQFFPVSITVLDQDGMDFLFGLDNLKRHQCMIDLKTNTLRFSAAHIALPFLSEHELPKKEGLDALGPARDAATADAAALQPSGGAGGPAATSPAAAAAGAPSQPQPAPANTGAGSALPADWAEKVQQLQALGFPAEQCVAALRQTNGNQEMAASILFSMFD